MALEVFARQNATDAISLRIQSGRINVDASAPALMEYREAAQGYFAEVYSVSNQPSLEVLKHFSGSSGPPGGKSPISLCLS